MFWNLKQGIGALLVWIVIIGAFLMWAKGVPKSPYQAFVVLVASVGGAIGSLVFIWLMSLIKTYVGAGSTAGILGPHEFELREDGLFERTSANETLTKWSAVKSVTRRSDFIYVEAGPSFFHLIPRRSFATDDAFENWYREVSRRTGNDV